MLFLSQVLGEEEDADRRKELIEVLTKAVKFTGQAQTAAGGWGYVSAKDGGDFDEGSTTITQVQGLRGCRNAGIPVPKEIIDKAVKYIRKCTGPDGGVAYNSHGGGGRPPITAAAIACLFNAGEYDAKEGDKEKVEAVRKMLKYCEQNLGSSANANLSFGHWHYANYYYSQVLYREGGDKWKAYRKETYRPPGRRSQCRRLLGPGLHGRGLHHRHEPHDPATRSRHAADLPTVIDRSQRSCNHHDSEIMPS